MRLRASILCAFVAASAFGSVAACGSGGDDGSGAAPVPPPPASGPTFFKDVEPIVSVSCAGCHTRTGIGGFAIDADTAPTLAQTMSEKVSAREMPPWPPGPLGLPLANARVLTEAQIATIVTWAKAGAPLGDPKDHQDLAPRITFAPGRPADLRVMMAGANVYAPKLDHVAADEVRCFVLDLPPGTPSGWVTALNWVPGTPGGIHHIGGIAVDPASAKVARSMYGKDGRPGYECAGGFGNGVKGQAGFGAGGAGKDTGTILPKGTGIFVPAGSSIVVTVHYVLKNLGASDASGVELWFARPEEKNGLRPLTEHKLNAPSELPCPTGVSADPSDRCSRAYGLARVKSVTPEQSKAVNDFLFSSCKKNLQAYYDALKFSPAPQAKFLVPTDCEGESPYDGVMHVLHNHMHTRGASTRLEQQQADGSWKILLDIPNWRWTWEGAYLLEQGVPVKVGQKLRVSCVFDNGIDKQWSAATGEPGHDRPATPPLSPPEYVVAGPERGSDMCTTFITLARPAYRAQTWSSICTGAQAVYDDLCTDGLATMGSQPCEGKNEENAVQLVRLPELAARFFYCAPKGPSASVGGGCDLLNNCLLACGATKGVSGGISSECVADCKANVYAYKPAQPALAASPLGAHRFDFVYSCAQAACAGATTYQAYLECEKASCTDVLQWCYQP